MNTLFDDAEMGIQSKPETSTGIKIVTSKDKPLSKQQQTFNRLTKRVENLQKEITAETDKMEKLLKLHSEKMPSLENAIAEDQIKLAKKISRSTDSIKYGKHQLENIGIVIVNLCDQAFATIEPDEDAEALYDQWSDTTYKEEVEMQEEEQRLMMENMLRFKMGIDIDLSEMDDSPESFARIQEMIQEELKKQKQEQAEQSANRKKTKKQLEKELRQKEEETMKLKSVRNIYISLAKALHPDTEPDPSEKLRKEELMKKVTAAYNDKDLPALLKLEMEWVASESHNLDKMSDDKLKLYISSLKEQVAELESEKTSLYHHPRFTHIARFAHYSESTAILKIKGLIREHKKQKKSLEEIYSIFSQPNPKKEILEFVNQSIEILDRQSFWDDFGMPF